MSKIWDAVGHIMFVGWLLVIGGFIYFIVSMFHDFGCPFLVGAMVFGALAWIYIYTHS